MELARLAVELERERAENAGWRWLDERTRIARELHDVVGHSLSLMVLQAGAERLAPRGRPAGAPARRSPRSSGRAASTLAELRRLVGRAALGRRRARTGPAPGLARLDDLVAQSATRD